MSAVKGTAGRRWRGPVRVATTAALVAAVVYIAVAAMVVVLVDRDAVARVDTRLDAALTRVMHESIGSGEQEGSEIQTDDETLGPMLLAWVFDASGTQSASNTTLILPSAYRMVSAPRTIDIGGHPVRVRGAASASAYVVVGQGTAEIDSTVGSLLLDEAIIGVLLVVLVFAGAVAVGRRVAAPLERAHQRQLDFTADASHELRTPLAVIEAQAALALERPRTPEWYTEAFGRVATEGRRMRRLVEDLLWLARLDASTKPAGMEPVDLAILAESAIDRFRVLAESLHQRLEVHTPDEPAIVVAPPEWIDRLLGVLLDNACKYTPEGGSVLVRVLIDEDRVRLEVDDSGPGIPETARPFVMDRFHRATSQAEGAGLGLAIGDAVVRSTGGQWHIGASDLGGASVGVSWPRFSARG